MSAPGTNNNSGEKTTPTAGPTAPSRFPVMPHGRTSGAVQAFNVWALLAALKRRWLLATCLGLLVAPVGAIGMWFLLPPVPAEVAAQLHMAVKQQSGGFWEKSDSVAFGIYQKTQIALLKSRLVLNAALRDKEVAQLSIVKSKADPVLWLEGAVMVRPFGSPEILRVRMSGQQPEQLQVLVDKIIDSYLQEVVLKDRAKEQARLDDFKSIAKIYEEKLKRERADVRRLRERLKAANDEGIKIEKWLLEAQLTKDKSELVEVKRKIRELELVGKMSGAKPDNSEKSGIPQVVIDQVIGSDPDMQKLEGQKLALERDIAEIRRRAVDPNPWQVRAPERQLRAVIEAIAERKKKLQPLIEKQFQSRIQLSASGSHLSREEQLKYLKELQNTLEADIKTLNKRSNDLVVRQLDLQAKEREIERIGKIEQQLNERVERMELDLERRPVRVQRLGKPVIRITDNRARKVKMAGMAGAGSFCFVLLIVALLEYRARRLSSSTELVQAVGLNLVGTVPAYSKRSGRYGASQGYRHLMESVDAARTLLLNQARYEQLQVIMIVSAVSGEAKTSLACHLGTSIARAGRRTLLIDADLRKPTAHDVFQLPLEPGLSELLIGEATLDQTIRETTIPNLSFLPAGECQERTLQSLANDGVIPILGELKKHYDFILIDTSPVLPVPDALMIGEHVDGAIFSVLQHFSSLPKIHAACQRLFAVGIRILGAVLNGSDESSAGYTGYGYSYGYGNRPDNAPQPSDTPASGN